MRTFTYTMELCACGEWFEKRSPNAIHCLKCRKRLKQQYFREYQQAARKETRRAGNGIAKQCSDCHETFRDFTKNENALRCPKCRKIAASRNSKAEQREERRKWWKPGRHWGCAHWVVDFATGTCACGKTLQSARLSLPETYTPKCPDCSKAAMSRKPRAAVAA